MDSGRFAFGLNGRGAPVVVALGIGFGLGQVWTPVSPALPARLATVEETQPAATATAVGNYEADVLRIVDGDTAEMRVHTWLGQDIVTKVRLRGVDAPELRARCAAEAQAAEQAKARLAALLADGPVTVVRPKPDKYFGRVVAALVLSDGRDVSSVLLGEGLARAYDGRTRQGWC